MGGPGPSGAAARVRARVAPGVRYTARVRSLLVLALLFTRAPAWARDVYVYRAANGTLVFTDSPHHDEFDLWWRDAVPGVSLPNGVPMPRLDRIANLNAYDALFVKSGDAEALPPELLKALAVAESRMNPKAQSHAGARGLMQLMPATARSLGVADSDDPVQAVPAGARYLARQITRFGSYELGLAAYNAGPGAVEKAGGIPRNGETPTYVARVMGLYQHFRDKQPVTR